jgi:hypothetical protein
MSRRLFISFLVATIVLLVIPGPTVLQCIGDALANRRRQNWSTILGVGVGDAAAMSLSLLGAGALLRTSAAAYAVMKTGRGVYLTYLGVRAIKEARASRHTPAYLCDARHDQCMGLYVGRRISQQPLANKSRSEEGRLCDWRGFTNCWNAYARPEETLEPFFRKDGTPVSGIAFAVV